MNVQEAELSERQLTLDLVGPQIVMYRRYGNHLVPYKATKFVEYKENLVYDLKGKRVRGENVPNTNNARSRLGSLMARWRHGGFEINLFPANKHGFDAALKLLTTREILEAHMGKLDTHIPDPYDLEMWVFLQLELKAFKRIK
jgi:hypothetical protein